MDVGGWLRNLGLGQYEPAFIANAIESDVLPELTEGDLEKLGIPMGDRKRLIKAIGAMVAGSPRAFTARGVGEDAQKGQAAAERRHLTVMICDLVGSTALSARLDPEDMGGVIDAYHAACARIILTHEGFLADFRGDGVIAYFGYPLAHEDDAERTVRAGLDIIAAIARLETRAGEPLAVRIGIATGLVVVGDLGGEGSLRQHAVVGDAPNLAARLQALVEPGTIVVAASTRRLLGNLFRLRDLGLREVKGIAEPVPAWAVEGVSAFDSRFEAFRAARLSNLIGREDEIDFLLERQHMAWGGEGQIVLISGEPGIGKSHLAAALAERIAGQPHTLLRFQCSPYHINSALHPFITQLERAAGFRSDDTSEHRLDKLEAVLAMGASRAQAVAPLFAALLSIPLGERYEPLALSPRQQRRRTLAALRDQLENLARKQPILIVFEDVHWADATSLELLDFIVKRVRQLPILALFTLRPEFESPWLGLRNVGTMTLGRLDRNDVESMVMRVTGGCVLPAEVIKQIVTKTDGNPLFVEELAKAVLEAGILVEHADGYRLAGPLLPFAIPPTLPDSLMARLDRLAPVKVKEIAQIGAAIGREFSYSLVRAVVASDETALKHALADLEQAELVYRRGEPPEAVYSFKHALVRDAAYESLLKSRRQQLHGRIADAIEEGFPEMVETQPELLAHHLIQAKLTERAINYLRKASQRSIERSANAEAVRHLTQALELLQSHPEGPGRTRAALGLEVMLSQAMITGYGYAARETAEVLLRAKAHIDDLTDPSQKLAILYGIWACHYVGGEIAKQTGAAAEFLTEAERHNDTVALCVAHRIMGTTYVTKGEFTAALPHLEQARALYDPRHNAPLQYQYGQDVGAAALCYLSWALWHLGSVDKASQVAADAVKRAEELSHPHTQVFTICHARGMIDIFQRRSEDMRSYAGSVVSLCNEHGLSHWMACGRILEGWAATSRGEVDQGIELLRAGVAAWRKAGARLWLPLFLALEAVAYAKGGRSDAALEVIEQAIAISEETGEHWCLAEILRIKAELLSATDRAGDQVETLLAKSLEIARRQQARCWELRTACDLASLWQSKGRAKEALHLLQPIYAQFTEGFDTADLRRAKLILDSLRPIRARSASVL